MHIVATPTDPLYASNQWSLPQIGLPTAWNTSTGSASMIVAVIDTGVDAAHPDLSGKITTGANAGYNFVGGNTNTADDHFHGTFVASIVAANTNNGAGGAGVCWACKIMPIKVLDSTGSGSTFNVAQGVDWAVSHGAKVINLSLGSSSSDATLQTAVNNAWTAGVIVVAASGNNNGPVLYPAAYANAIAVGSNNQAGVRSSFSNFGAELDIMAPGESVFGALCTCASYAGGYGTGSGTSFAAPHLAGVVGLLISAGITDKDTDPHQAPDDGHRHGRRRLRQQHRLGPRQRRRRNLDGHADAHAHPHQHAHPHADAHAYPHQYARRDTDT